MTDLKKKFDEDEIAEEMNSTEPVEDSENPAEDTPNEESESVSEPVSELETEPVSDSVEDEQDTFPRDYVEKLRDENARYRQRAQRADDLAQRLHTALVEGTGRVQDASDVPFDDSHIDDPEALTAAIDELLKAKPHLAARRLTGNIGQGTSSTAGNVDLLGMLRARA